MRVIVIYNVGAGRERVPPERVVSALAEAGVEAEVVEVSGTECREAASRAVAERGSQVDAVVAAGGDGTVSAVAAALAGSETPLGVLPLGTLNHFARDLGIPAELAGAARVVGSGVPRQVDVAEVNGRPFVNNSSIGFYPRAVRGRKRLRRFVGKWLGLAVGTVIALARLPRMRLRLKLGAGDDARGRRPGALYVTPFLFVGNNLYDGAGLLAERHRTALDRGRLSILVARRASRLRLLVVAVRWLFGAGRGEDLAELSERAVLVLSRRRTLHVAADGEILTMRPPLRYIVRPGALRVLAPAPVRPAS